MVSERSTQSATKRGSDRPAAATAARRRDWKLEAIIAAGEVELLFQPQIAPGSGRVHGAEALARSALADSAALFQRASRAGLGERLSRFVQAKALRTAAAWDGPLRGLNISINILPEDIAREGYERWLLDEIAASGINPARVTLELTESALLVGQAEAAQRLAVLRDAGLRIAIDDFGTGYASLAYLTTLPLDMLKVDRGLIADIVGGERDRIVVKALIRLARELDLKVVVEGVESIGQLALLAEWGCDYYQGFLGAGALCEEELARFVATSHSVAA